MRAQTMRIGFFLLFGLLTAVFIAMLWPFAKPVFLAFTLAILFSPLYRILRRVWKGNPYFAAIGTALLVGACVVLPVSILGAVVVTKAGGFLHSIAGQMEAKDLSEQFFQMITTVQHWLGEWAGIFLTPAELEQTILEFLKKAGKGFYDFSPKMFVRTASMVFNFIFLCLCLPVFLAEGERLGAWLESVTPLPPEHWKEMVRNVRRTITSSFTAMILIGVAQGTLLALGFYAAGFSKVYGWWLIAVLACMIPVVGATSCYSIASIALLAMGNVKGAILFFLFGVGIVSTIDNFLRPWIMKNGVQLHPILLFVTMIGGIKLMGPIGVLAGPIILVIFLSTVRIYRQDLAQTES